MQCIRGNIIQGTPASLHAVAAAAEVPDASAVRVWRPCCGNSLGHVKYQLVYVLDLLHCTIAALASSAMGADRSSHIPNTAASFCVFFRAVL